MAADLAFTDKEMAIDEGLGYSKAYAKLCRDRTFTPYFHGPPFTFTPYSLQQNEAMRAKELDKMFPIIDPYAKPTTKPKIFASLLWKQLNHLGNAGFDPAIFRVDQYGNVLYYHAESASPLSWDIDHWFPCSRGGLTVPSNLRILQRQVCKKKQNKLEFLIPWWDLQLGISINQFMSIFASSNSDFRHRAFSLLFAEGESEELNASQTVDTHNFPPHFMESKEKVGLAPAAVVISRGEFHDASALRSLDVNRSQRSRSPIVAASKSKSSISKENENPDMVTNPYQAIVMARDSLRQSKETVKLQAEIQRLDDEVSELKLKTEEEKMAIQDLELELTKRKRRSEKCRRLAEAQSSYRAMLEKMIRDAMHQSVIYKEQVRLNQAASNALMARLEAQKAICDTSELQLHRKFKQRDELEKQIKPEWEQARKRSRTDDALFEEQDEKTGLLLPGRKQRIHIQSDMDGASMKERDEMTLLYLPWSKPEAHLQKEMNGTLLEKKDDKTVLYLPGVKSRTPIHKELRVFLEEEQKASDAGLSLNEERMREETEEERSEAINNVSKGKPVKRNKVIVATEDEDPVEDKLQKLKLEEQGKMNNIRFSISRQPELEEDEESRKQRGKGNVEKWLQMLLETTQEGTDLNTQNDNGNQSSRTDEIIRKMDLLYPQKEVKILKYPESQDAEGMKQFHEIHDQQPTKEKDGGKSEEETAEMEACNTCLDGNKTVPGKDDGDKGKEEIIEIETRNTLFKRPPYQILSENNNANVVGCVDKGVGSSNRFEGKETREKNGKEGGLVRCESARALRRIPSSPSVILGIRKGVDCIRKKPLVIGDDDGHEDHKDSSSFLKSSLKTIKKAVKI